MKIKQTSTMVVAFGVIFLCFGSGFAKNTSECVTGTEWGGFTTEEPSMVNNYYEIDTPEKLAWISCVSSDMQYDKNVKLTADLDLENKKFVPIGAYQNSYFKAIFEGNEHTISNLYIDPTTYVEIRGEALGNSNDGTAYIRNVGFIANFKGTLQNLKIENLQIEMPDGIVNQMTLKSNGTHSNENVSIGGFIGYADENGSAVIQNCSISGTIKSNGDWQRLGGIAGHLGKGKLLNNSSNVSIYAEGNEISAGGILGLVSKNNKTNDLSGNSYSGTIELSGTNTCAGGIVGKILDNNNTAVLEGNENNTDLADIGLDNSYHEYGAIKVSHIHSSKKKAVINGNYTGTKETVISENIEVDTVKFNRTFTKNVMATLMLPFDIDTSRVKGGKAYRFKRVDENDDGSWKVIIGKLQTEQLKANTPYMFLPTATSMTFTVGSVTMNTSTAPSEELTSGNWEYKGVYSYISSFGDIKEDGVNYYGFAGQAMDGTKVGQFVKAGDSASINPFKAYLTRTENSSLSKSYLGLSNFFTADEIEVDIEDEDGNITDTGIMNTQTGEVCFDRWYDLQGRKLNHKPTVKGTYYHNGNKVIVK